MTRAESGTGPIKAWIEPDRWALLRAFPLRALLFVLATLGSALLGYLLHPAFFLLTALSLLRHASAEAHLRELFRDGMLHPAVVVEGARGLIATLVRLDDGARAQDAVVISRMPRRWAGQVPPWGGARAAMVIAGNPPRLRPLSPDIAVRDPRRAKRAAERIPDEQWHALARALAQLEHVREGVHPVELGDAPWYGSVCDLETEGSLPAHLDAAEPHAWCAGLPAVEEPAMVERELARVGALRRRALRSAFALLGALGAALAIVLLGGFTASVRSALLAAWVAAAPLTLLLLGRALGRARLYLRDLRDGSVLRFAGSVSSFDSLGLDRDLARMARRGVISPEPGLPQDFVVLKHAQELLHANGKWAPRGLRLHVSRVAAPPADPVKLALPSELRTHSLELLDVGRRRLTTAERDELSRHAERLKRPGATVLILTPLAYGALFLWSQHGWLLPPHLASAPLVLGMWLIAAQAAWRRSRFAARLRSDVELGWVVTVDHGRAGVSDDPELPARGVESLLHGRLDWTVNRRPATWRRYSR